MFRIKTDIRQYKCESKDKVEKLIRNWVIRPNDLIYDVDGKEWAPIGEHPAFVRLFGMLDEQERNMPDTVVTRREPYDGDDGDDPNGAADGAIEEVTQLAGRPRASDADGDARSTDVFDQEEIAESVGKKSNSRGKGRKPPVAPAGVEAPSRDEVTTMTERTLEMLKITDEDSAPKSPPDPVEEEEKDDEDDEVTGVRDRGTDEGADEDEDEPPLPPTKERLRDKVLESGPKLGRHDLPEELFATNEISSPEVQEQLKRLDELGELDPSDPEPKPSERGTQDSGDWPLRLDEDSGVDEAWDVIAEDLRTTEELDDATQKALADTDEAERDDFDDDEWTSNDTPPPEPKRQRRDFVSDGYKMALPFPVRPTADDIRYGMPQGRVSRAAKDRTYPPPQPKVPGEVHHRVFDLTKKKPRDRTMIIIAVVAFVILMIAILVASC